jgi:hypothetical protein
MCDTCAAETLRGGVLTPKPQIDTEAERLSETACAEKQRVVTITHVEPDGNLLDTLQCCTLPTVGVM